MKKLEQKFRMKEYGNEMFEWKKSGFRATWNERMLDERKIARMKKPYKSRRGITKIIFCFMTDNNLHSSANWKPGIAYAGGLVYVHVFFHSRLHG